MSNPLDIRNFSIDKTGWKKVKFGDVVFEPKESVKNPFDEGIRHVVGLEHIDSEDIHLRRSASIEEETTFTKRFSKGDVLFGRRRAYLKKAAQADFEGICSGDITVMRVKEFLLPELLPFIVNNDKFFDFAITHSAGGLSPRVKFKDLANLEVSIPPEAKQREILELLAAALNLHENCKTVLAKQADLLRSYRMEFFARENWKHKKLKNIFDVQLGKMLSAKARIGNTPSIYLTNQNIQWGHIELNKLNKMDFSEQEKQKFSLKKGDILVCEGGEVGRSAIWREQISECYYQKALHRLRVKDECYLPEIMLEYMFWVNDRGMFKGLTGHSTIAHLTAVKLKELDVPDIPIEKQVVMHKYFKVIYDAIKNTESKLRSSAELKKAILNEVF